MRISPNNVMLKYGRDLTDEWFMALEVGGKGVYTYPIPSSFLAKNIDEFAERVLVPAIVQLEGM